MAELVTADVDDSATELLPVVFVVAVVDDSDTELLPVVLVVAVVDVELVATDEEPP